MNLYPLVFRPIFKERVWGGAKLKQFYNKSLPSAGPIGESWEISDRPGDVSIIDNGPLTGKDLHWLVQHHAQEVIGESSLQNGRFPLLIKILDCQQKLSLQVHPPPAQAKKLGGEPKTEMWYIADAAPNAELYVGLKRGVTPDEFQQKLQAGTVSDCFHRIKVRAGDAMFLPSGRVHAIGAGLLIFEVQQNSDTTYRVFDWNRVGLDGKPRALHLDESLASIDFNDFEPPLISSKAEQADGVTSQQLVDDPLFKVELLSAANGKQISFDEAKLRILGVIKGHLLVSGGAGAEQLSPGHFCLIPAGIPSAQLSFDNATTLLKVEPGDQ